MQMTHQAAKNMETLGVNRARHLGSALDVNQPRTSRPDRRCDSSFVLQTKQSNISFYSA